MELTIWIFQKSLLSLAANQVFQTKSKTHFQHDQKGSARQRETQFQMNFFLETSSNSWQNWKNMKKRKRYQDFQGPLFHRSKRILATILSLSFSKRSRICPIVWHLLNHRLLCHPLGNSRVPKISIPIFWKLNHMMNRNKENQNLKLKSI